MSQTLTMRQRIVETIASFRIHYSLSHITRYPLTTLPTITDHMIWCHTLLCCVSRSFALVIASLPHDVRLSVTIMYLLLRALDTVEDDMSLPLALKKHHLLTFHTRLTSHKYDDLMNIGDTAECQFLLQHLGRIISVYETLPETSRTIITSIVQDMGSGMSQFLRETNHQHSCMHIDTLMEYNLYGHYVAGLVGHALSRLWCEFGYEDTSLAQEHVLANSMGLLLQKTNMIRDYREDLISHRHWWPRSVWNLYVDRLEELGEWPHRTESISCLNHMITDALSHVPDCLDYLSRLRNPQLFRSCAIPQVLAFATLAHMYSNPLVYTSTLRIRQGLTCHIMTTCYDMIHVAQWINLFATQIKDKVIDKDKGAKRTLDLLTLIQRLSIQHIYKHHPPRSLRRPFSFRSIHMILLMILCCACMLWCMDHTTCTSWLISSPPPISWLGIPLVSLSSIRSNTATAQPIERSHVIAQTDPT